MPAHNPEVVGSNPTPTTRENAPREILSGGVFMLGVAELYVAELWSGPLLVGSRFAHRLLDQAAYQLRGVSVVAGRVAQWDAQSRWDSKPRYRH